MSSGDLARAPGERDPLGVHDWLADVNAELYPSEGIALREAFYELRLRGTADGEMLKAAATEAASRYDPKLWNDDRGEHALTTQDYFERLPHVGRSGGGYQFEGDPANPSGPAAGPVLDGVEIAAQAVAPDADERAEIRKRATQAVADEHGRPGEPHREAMNPTRHALESIYDEVIRSGTLTARAAAGHYEPPDPPYPEYGDAARDAGLWMREFGRPVLESRHVVGVEVPETLADPYPFVFVGVDADADLALESVERADVEAAVDSLLDATDTGGRGAWRDRRRATLAALFERVRDDGPIDAETLIDEEIPAREIGYADPGSFWREVARDALLSLPGVGFENGGEETWHYDHDAALRAVHESG